MFKKCLCALVQLSSFKYTLQAHDVFDSLSPGESIPSRVASLAAFTQKQVLCWHRGGEFARVLFNGVHVNAPYHRRIPPTSAITALWKSWTSVPERALTANSSRFFGIQGLFHMALSWFRDLTVCCEEAPSLRREEASSGDLSHQDTNLPVSWENAVCNLYCWSK